MVAKQLAVKRYIVMLSADERERLNTLIQKGTSPARQVLKARILLKADASEAGEAWSDGRIKFLEAIHYFTVHSITWRALPEEFGKWNSVWKRFWRLSRSGVFEAFFQMLAECSETAHLIQFFDSTTARAHVSAAGAKGGSSIRPSAARVAASRPKSTSRPISTATLSTST